MSGTAYGSQPGLAQAMMGIMDPSSGTQATPSNAGVLSAVPLGSLPPALGGAPGGVPGMPGMPPGAMPGGIPGAMPGAPQANPLRPPPVLGGYPSQTGTPTS